MNRRIRSDDLHSPPYKELIHTLANQWVNVAPPAHGLAYDDFTHTVAILLLTIQNPDRASAIVKAVLEQANRLHKPCIWIEQELKFEGMLEGADRTDFLRLELSQSSGVDDTALDLYNERVNRFSENR